MRHRHAHTAVVVLAVGLAFLAGCGGGSDKPAVSGTVSFDGTPVDNGAINFIPQAADGGPQSSVGAEIKEGKYSIPAGKRPTPGKYRVQIVWNKKTGKQVDAPGDPGNKIDETKQVIPTKFNADSQTYVEITSGENTHNFDLKSR